MPPLNADAHAADVEWAWSLGSVLLVGWVELVELVASPPDVWDPSASLEAADDMIESPAVAYGGINCAIRSGPTVRTMS